MRVSSLMGVLALGLWFAAFPVRATQRLEAGRWEVKVDVSDGGSGLKPPSTSQTECLSQQDVDADPLPEMEKGACRATKVQRSGDRVTWDLDCGPLGKGRGEVTYRSPTLYDGWITLDLGGASVKATVRATRVGDC